MINNSNKGERIAFSALRLIFLTALLLTLSFAASAQNANVAESETNAKKEAKQTTNAVSADETQNRIRQLEAQGETMKTQIESLKNLINQTQKNQKNSPP